MEVRRLPRRAQRSRRALSCVDASGVLPPGTGWGPCPHLEAVIGAAPCQYASLQGDLDGCPKGSNPRPMSSPPPGRLRIVSVMNEERSQVTTKAAVDAQ